MLTFKEFLGEARDVNKTKEHLTNLANHPHTPEHEKSAAHAALGRLHGSNGHHKAPEEHKDKPLAVGHTHLAGNWKKTHKVTNHKGEERYVSHDLKSGTHKVHNRSESEKSYHPSAAKALSHLKDRGFHKVVTAKSSKATDIRVAKTTKTRHTSDQFSDSPFKKKEDQYPNTGGKIRGSGS